MAKKNQGRRCRTCGSELRFVAWFKHHVTGKIIRACNYGKRVFVICPNAHAH